MTEEEILADFPDLEPEDVYEYRAVIASNQAFPRERVSPLRGRS